jgi:hypothetical protein
MPYRPHGGPLHSYTGWSYRNDPLPNTLGRQVHSGQEHEQAGGQQRHNGHG